MNFSIYTFANLCRTMYHLKVGCYLLGHDLRIDGSNFPRCHLRLRDILLHNDLLFMTMEPLAEAPG
jgi:hypothetical protein